MPRYFTHSFGCRANQADGAALEQDLAARGFLASDNSATADVVVLNSCTVTAAADADLRQTARRIHRQNPQARIVITGCYAQRRPEELAALPGVAWVVGNTHKSELAALFTASPVAAPAAPRTHSFVPLAHIAGEDYFCDDDASPLGDIAAAAAPRADSDRARILSGDIAAQRQFTAAPFFGGTVEDRTRPNLKIQDGCNNRCSFCIIPSVRGLSRSLPVDDCIAQVQALGAAGYREVVISGVNLGQYGRDLSPRTGFPRLLRRILDETSIEKLRLSSLEPMDFTDALLDLMASTGRIARHVHAPLQSGSDRILRRMHRKYRAAEYGERVLAAQARMPHAAFGADVIAGFPGETQSDFDQTYSLIDSLPFTYLHVFPYSRRPGTPADRMRDQVPGPVIRERGRLLRELAARKNLAFRERQIGRTLAALTLDAPSGGPSVALSDNYLRVTIPGGTLQPNQPCHVRIQAVAQVGLIGEALNA